MSANREAIADIKRQLTAAAEYHGRADIKHGVYIVVIPDGFDVGFAENMDVIQDIAVLFNCELVACINGLAIFHQGRTS